MYNGRALGITIRTLTVNRQISRTEGRRTSDLARVREQPAVLLRYLRILLGIQESRNSPSPLDGRGLG